MRLTHHGCEFQRPNRLYQRRAPCYEIIRQWTIAHWAHKLSIEEYPPVGPWMGRMTGLRRIWLIDSVSSVSASLAITRKNAWYLLIFLRFDRRRERSGWRSGNSERKRYRCSKETQGGRSSEAFTDLSRRSNPALRVQCSTQEISNPIAAHSLPHPSL